MTLLQLNLKKLEDEYDRCGNELKHKEDMMKQLNEEMAIFKEQMMTLNLEKENLESKVIKYNVYSFVIF